MAKKVVATLKTSTGKSFAKVIRMVRSEKTGAYMVGARAFAKHPLLAHRQSFECVKWL